MIFFKDITFSGRRHLVILDHEDQRTQDGMLQRVHESLTGKFVNAWPKLTNPVHQKGWSRQIEVSKTPI
ncbi:hypothetical protein C2S53_002778, partial [Perilla frutescens var. hirtella]